MTISQFGNKTLLLHSHKKIIIQTMETALIIAQTVFYSVFSLAIIVVGILLAIATYHLVNIVRELEAISRNLHNMSDEAQEKIKDIIEKLSVLPILSFLIKKAKTKEKFPKSRKS